MQVDVFKRLQDYVGREYRVDYNCAHLMRDVQADLFGRDIALPGVMPAGVAGQRRMVNEMRDELALQIAVPFQGCAVLLSSRSEEGHEVLHIGAVALRDGEPYVLHNSAHFGSARFEKLEALKRHGMKFCGWFAWR